MSQASSTLPEPARTAEVQSAAPAGDPRVEYQRRLDARRNAEAHCERLDARLAAIRGVLFLTAIGLAVAAYLTASVAWWLTLLPLVVFVAVLVYHAKVIDRRDELRRACTYYETALARLDGRWSHARIKGDRYTDPNHPYTSDLDIFGSGSLFQLICRARTRLGEDVLAEWLSRSADASLIRDRQAALSELTSRLDLRERLAVLSAQVHDDYNQNRLLIWAAKPPQPFSLAVRLLAVFLAALTAIAVVLSLVTTRGLAPLIAMAILDLLMLLAHGRRIKRAAQTAAAASSGLAILSQVLAVLESEAFTSRLLSRMRERIEIAGQPPSQRIARLQKLIQGLNNSLQNQFLAPVAIGLCLPIHYVHAIEMWRVEIAPHIKDWLEAVGLFEACCSLAGYAYEHPSDPYPEITEQGPAFEGASLGHPLLDESKCVRNDLRFTGDLRLYLISGSNMSGKSTLLRTVGTNSVLALAGAPVRASRLRIAAPMQIGTAMRVHDSLQAGQSFFYASVARIKSVLELERNPEPLLFLLDEILQGTNSHDRRLGAEAVILELVARGAIGLVTTHDLALTSIAERLGPQAVNIHFEDELIGGRMSFDYRIKPGVVHKSNALELMRMMGINVKDDDRSDDD